MWVALLGLIIVPGATYEEFAASTADPGELVRFAPWAVGGLTLYIVATWIEWLARVAAMRRQPALVLLAPAALIGGYAIVCRVIGPVPVDTALLQSVGFVLFLVIMALVAAVFVVAGALGLNVLYWGIWLLWWPFGHVARWWCGLSTTKQ
jgi:hypothetical protein